MRIHFDVWTPDPNRKLTKRDRLKFWFMRQSLYQRYAWRKYGKKIDVTRWSK